MISNEQMVQIIADACNDEKAIDVLVLDVVELTIIADYFIIASGRSHLQVRSIVETVIERLQEHGILPLRKEGQDGGSWVVLDYGSIILHVFRENEREYYDLEGLWRDAREVKIDGN